MVYTVPYLTYLVDTDTDKSKYCLINLISKNAISYYDIAELSEDCYEEFMDLAEKWWNSCPMIPISVFFQKEFKKFANIKKVIRDNKYKILRGFSGVAFDNLTDKRIKRHIINIDAIYKKSLEEETNEQSICYSM